MTIADCLNPIIAYFIGAIPFGLVLSQIFGDGDLREQGSGNIGATNVYRTQGKALGVATFILDFAKSFLACYLLMSDIPLINLLVLVAPVLGHMFTIYLKFKGGKGVAAYLGVLCYLNIYAFLGTLLVWGATFAVTKISSVSSLISTISSCIIFFFLKNEDNLEFVNQLYALIFLVAIIVVKHRENIKRLLDKSELKV